MSQGALGKEVPPVCNVTGTKNVAQQEQGLDEEGAVGRYKLPANEVNRVEHSGAIIEEQTQHAGRGGGSWRGTGLIWLISLVSLGPSSGVQGEGFALIAGP